MNKKEVIELLKTNAGSGKAIRSGPKGSVKNFGIGLTELRKLARKIGRDHALAQELWESDVFEARVLGLLIDDPKLISREQAEHQVDQLDEPTLKHVFCSCDSSLAKVPFIVELIEDWTASKNQTRRSCGYGLLSELASSKKKSVPGDDFFMRYINKIEEIYRASGDIEGGYALLCIGKRNKKLNAAALKVAKLIGPIYYGDEKNCEPFDVVGHLTKDHLKKRLGIQ
jgi:hypothetical protein